MPEKNILLIVEDEETAAKALEHKFRHAGFETTLAKNGTEALSLLSEHTYDAVLLDLILPEKDGYEVLEEMQKTGNRTPVVVLTNLAAEADAERTKSLGAAAHFTKSMTQMKDVVTFIENLIRR